ncbi:hypothetical protein M0D21_19640 [Aquimarina sp. D1M17]|uniref:hypothetical protein n=1 Tax=Aquimarina acroporae TaxID=2937283 RepID=UPI0020BD789E|nr:hypothetical protein [Aquimarina acroporae]MCK8523804.1 hypothetical protein [Aquimarina acroporae]
MMKSIKRYIVLLSIAMVLSCSGDDDGGTPFFTQNSAPTVPSLVFPTNNLTCTSIDLELVWGSSTDIDDDAIRYEIEIAEVSNFSTITFTAITTAISEVFDLEKGITYYWRVRAIDSKDNASEYSATQSFFTEPEATINALPGIPELGIPALGSRLSGSLVTLTWSATDSDDDALSYDLYFGDTNPPVLFAENIAVNTFDVSVSPGTAYYWRIVVRDNHQSATIGPVWNFRTE